MKIYNILNLGAGVQSSRVLLGACNGELPKFDAAIFADTQWEPKAVYRNLEFLKSEADKAGIPVLISTKGNLRADAIAFRRFRESDDGKRYASIPVFIRNADGSQGRVKRQCTKEYKIEVVENVIRRVILELKPRQRIPKGVQVRQWFGISEDEGTRATFPGRFKAIQINLGTDLLGQPLIRDGKKWTPTPWRENVYPLLNEVWRHDRTILSEPMLPRREHREDCAEWLANHYPDRVFPRSACLGCPFRTNAEWAVMRDESPDEFEDACRFDDEQRAAQMEGRAFKRQLQGVSYIHRQLVPLRMANLDGAGERKGGGCGTLLDGLDGLCDT